MSALISTVLQKYTSCVVTTRRIKTCFTERENIYDQVSHDRFMALVMQSDVDIYEVKEDSNSFGEYLFVTVSCRNEQPKRLLTFWGLDIMNIVNAGL